MELTGEHRIPAPRQKVWEALNDPEILKACIKGCQKLEKLDDNHMAATVQAKVGPVKATFDATVEIRDAVPPEHYTLAGEGKGGVAGFAKGSADVSLAEDGADATVLTYRANAQVGGKLAQIGSRLVETTAKKYAADFFETFSEKLGGSPAAAASAAAGDMPAAAATAAVINGASAAADIDGASAAADMEGASAAADMDGRSATVASLSSVPSSPGDFAAAGGPAAAQAAAATPAAHASVPAAQPSVPSARTAPSSATSSDPAPAAKSGGFGPMIWIGLAVAAAIVAIIALT